MKMIVTGAEGFVGRGLVAALAPLMAETDELVLIDRQLEPVQGRGRVRLLEGSASDRSLMAEAMAGGADVVWHLAAALGMVAEPDLHAGLDANLHSILTVMETATEKAPGARIVNASSVAVYGSPVPSEVNDYTLPNANSSYAAQKLVSEILLDDFTRRGHVDGLSLRLSGVMARTPGYSSTSSAFLNNVFHVAREGGEIVMPCSPDMTTWLISRQEMTFNLQLAARLPASALPARRHWALPALTARMGDLVAALARRYGPDVTERVTFAPDPKIEAMFWQPPLKAEMAVRLGFRADADCDALVDRVHAQYA